jgi:preprotein translocase subunit SecE
MNTKAIKPSKPETVGSGADIVKYVLAALILVSGVFGFYWFGTWATPLRALMVVLGLVAAFAVFTQTVAGQDVLEFVRESQFELRKVVWPTREKSLQMTGVIIVVIVVMSIVLSLIDWVLGTGIAWLLS